MCNYSHFGLGLSSLTVICLLKPKIGISHQQPNKKTWETPQISHETKENRRHSNNTFRHFVWVIDIYR